MPEPGPHEGPWRFSEKKEPSKFSHVPSEHVKKLANSIAREISKEFKLLDGRDLKVSVSEIPYTRGGSGIFIKKLDESKLETNVTYALNHLQNLIGYAEAHGFTLDELTESIRGSSLVHDEVGHLLNDAWGTKIRMPAEYEKFGREEIETEVQHFISGVHSEKTARELLKRLGNESWHELRGIHEGSSDPELHLMKIADVLKERFGLGNVDAIRQAEHLRYYLIGPNKATEVLELFDEAEANRRQHLEDDYECYKDFYSLDSTPKDRLFFLKHHTKMSGGKGDDWKVHENKMSNLFFVTGTKIQQKLRHELPELRTNMVEAEAENQVDELRNLRSKYKALITEAADGMVAEFDKDMGGFLDGYKPLKTK